MNILNGSSHVGTNNNKMFCCVYNCNAKRKNLPHVSFHRFPKEGFKKVQIENKFGKLDLIDLRKAWILKLKMGKPVSKYMVVCSQHFNENDYIRNKGTGKRNYLKKNAVPSQNLPALDIIKKRKTPSDRTNMCKKRVLTNNESDMAAVDPVELNIGTNQSHTQEEMEVAEQLLCLNTVPKTITKEIEIQVTIPQLETICELISTDKQLNSLTGLNSFTLLNVIIELVEKVYKDERSHRLTLRARIIMTFMKLKNDISYVVLSVLFGGISSQTCKVIFFSMLDILSIVLKPLIYFPEKCEIVANLPVCFKKFSNVRVVLDCTEIFLQSNDCLSCRINTYSHYKSANTVKFMVGVSPAGLITFISKGYGGKTSDKAIFEQSNIINFLEPYIDAIMIDKGFLVDELCDNFAVKIIRPPFLRKKKQFSAAEADINKCIAAARVHIERVNQRIKIFKIFSNKLAWNLVPKVDQMFVIVCAICNMSNPILSDIRF